MELLDYQQQTATTAIYPIELRELSAQAEPNLAGILYTAMGLCSEAGEVAGKLKKVLRDGKGEMHPLNKAALAKEVGDCLWYVTELCSMLGYSLEEVATANLQKLASRQGRQVLPGDGDNR